MIDNVDNCYLCFPDKAGMNLTEECVNKIKDCKYITYFKFLPKLQMVLIKTEQIENLNILLHSMKWTSHKSEIRTKL